MVCIALRISGGTDDISGGTDDYIICRRYRLGINSPYQVIFLRFTRKSMIAEKKHDASIPVVVPVIVSIVMVPMMVPVPLVPAVFIRVMVVAVAVVAVVVVSSVWLVSGANINAEPIVCFGFGGCQRN
jgi:hypothetical protein